MLSFASATSALADLIDLDQDFRRIEFVCRYP
jgi:hypothetical protein